MWKYFSKMFAALIACLSVVSSFAAGLSYEREAQILYDLGLYKGVSETEYKPELEKNLTREQATVILIRLFGQEDEAQKMSESKVRATLAKFVDAYEISDWAQKEVAYATSKGYIKGREKGNSLYFNPQGYLKGIDYASLILQQLKVTGFSYNKALDKLQSEGVITKEQKEVFNKDQLTRDDVIGISYGVLKASNKGNNKTVIENLVDTGKVSLVKASKAGLINMLTPTPIVIPTNMQEDQVLRRADGAVKLGQWKLTNPRNEEVHVNRIWFTAEYTGQVAVLDPEHVTDFSVEDEKGNVYAVFQDINGNPNNDIKIYVIAKKRVDLTKPFIMPAGSGVKEAEKEIFLYGRIKEDATPGGMLEIYLGDGSSIYEAKGKKSGSDIMIRGSMLKQDDEGKKIIALSKVVPEMGSYQRDPLARANVPVARVNFMNKGYRAIKIKQISFKELMNSTG
ncbi:MAG: S-layer homology domain-containing protein, partial [Clostridiales bacterium]|nr:S-layer homology domain-containing protein [Clostridiales bacterium]